MNSLNPTRYYEVTDLRPGSAWEKRHDQLSLLGTIVQPEGNPHTYHGMPGFHSGEFRIRQAPPSGRKIEPGTILYFAGVRLRPLTIKEQEKIDGSRHDAA